ncbi:MAG: SUMF1/EgtB/PvdO family nonheme iron enzyme, partial [Planctomycetota bacterium]
MRPRKELDLPKILTRLAKRELLERLPVKRGRSWGENGIVVKDINPHLTTFTADQDLVIDSLRDLFSGDQWSEVHGAGPSSLWHRDPATGNPLDPSRRFQAPHQPTSIFVLGDLGCFSPNHRAWIDWLRWGQALRGLGHHLYAMFPGDVQQIPKTLASAFSIQTWQSSRLMIRDPQMRRAVLDQLFVYAAPALLLEPGLLRDLRRLVPGATDASLEIDFWLDERLSNRNASGARIDRGLVEQELMPEFLRLSPNVQEQVLRTIRNWRRNRAENPELWFEEVLSLPGGLRHCVQEDVEPARASVRELERRWRSGDSDSEEAETWFYNQTRRLPAPAFEDSEVGDRLRRAYRELHNPADDCVPGTDPQEIPSEKTRQYRLDVNDQSLRIARASGQIKSTTPSSQSIQSSNGVFSCRWERESFWKGRKPEFVSNFGTDRYGAWFEFEVRGDSDRTATQRMRWVPAGEFLMGSPDTELERSRDEGPQHHVALTKGFWIADTPCTQAMWETVTGQNPSNFSGDHN